MLRHSAIAAAVGFTASLVCSLIVAWETVGAVALVMAPLFLVSAFLVFLIELDTTNTAAMLVAFDAPLVLVASFAAYAILRDAEIMKNQGHADGGGQFGLFFLMVHVAGLIAANVCFLMLVPKQRAH